MIPTSTPLDAEFARLAGDVFVHSSLKPLDQVKFSDVPEKLQVNLFGNECEGLCGV